MSRPRATDFWARLADAGLCTRQNAADYRSEHRRPHPAEWWRWAAELGHGRKLKPGMGVETVRALVEAALTEG